MEMSLKKRNLLLIPEFPPASRTEGVASVQRIRLHRGKHVLRVTRTLVVRGDRETEHPVRTALHSRKVQGGCQGLRLAKGL